MLRAVAERCGAEMLMTALEERHLDLYHWLMHSLMLPTLDFGLKTISKWAGIARTDEVTSGLQATSLYRHYRHSADPAIRDRLLDYNREDVDGLVEVIEHLRQLVSGSAGDKYAHNEVAQVIDVIHETAFAPSSSSATPEFRPISTWRSRRSQERIIERLDGAVASGRMTEEEAAQLRATRGTSDFDVAFDAIRFRWIAAARHPSPPACPAPPWRGRSLTGDEPGRGGCVP